MPWETRIHWLWGLLLPGRGWFLLALAGLVFGLAGWLLTNQQEPIWIGLLILATAGIGYSGVLVGWTNFTLRIWPGEPTLWEIRGGIAMTSDRHINMGMIGSLLYRQTPMGRLLDYGSLEITALGGPYEWENLGQFRTLRRILESQGQWMPRPRRAMRVALRERFGPLGLFLRHSAQRLQRWWRQRPRRMVRPAVKPARHSAYERFLHFAGDFLFPRNTLQFDVISAVAGASGLEPTEVESRIFLQILKVRHILIVDEDGRVYRHARIQSMQDVRNRVPADWFENYMRQTRAQGDA